MGAPKRIIEEVQQPQQQTQQVQQQYQPIPGIEIPKPCKHEYREALITTSMNRQICFIFCKNCGDSKRLY